MKPDFDFARDTATELLLEQNITGLFVDIRNFRLRSNIIIDTMQHYSKITGVSLLELQDCGIQGALTLKKHGKNVILYDDSETNERRKHWGITHEVGHIYLGHQDDSKCHEIEAHFFTAQVIAPEITLFEMAKQNVNLSSVLLYKYFNLSYEAARKRINTLIRKGYPSYGEIDKMLLIKHMPYINEIKTAERHVS